LENELDNLRKKTNNIENQQNEAIQQESFEEAEQLEIIIKQHHESVILLKYQLNYKKKRINFLNATKN
jgi:hypothetical protein